MARTGQTRARTWLNKAGVIAAMREANNENLGELATAVERKAKASMKGGGRGRSRGQGTPSEAGEPPHVQVGTLRASIRSAQKRMGLAWVIGPTTVAWYGAIHEFGTLDEGGHHPARPFMRPALDEVAQNLRQYYRRQGLAGTRAGRACEAAVKAWRQRQR